MKVLVTGGAGFIGSHITDALISRGDQVVILDNLDSQVHIDNKLPNYLNTNIEFINGDVRDPEVVEKALSGVDAVIYNAAAVGVGQSMYAINHYVDVNCRGAAVFWEELLKHRDRIKKVVIASSMSIYGEGSYVDSLEQQAIPQKRTAMQFTEKNWEMLNSKGEVLKPIPTAEGKKIEPTSIYAITKRDQEEMFLTLGKTYNIPVVAFRYFNVIGTRQSLSNPYTGVAAIFCSRLLNGNSPIIFEDGLQMRDFVDVRDVVQANLLALDRGDVINDYFNIGSGSPINIQNLASKIATTLNLDIQPTLLQEARAGDIRHCFADITKANKILGYAPKFTIDESIKELVGWLGNQAASDKVDYSYQELKNNKLVK